MTDETMGDWQPIETAPRDGALVRLDLAPFGPSRVCSWRDGSWRYGRGWCFIGSQEQAAKRWRPATELERHMDQDFPISRLDEIDAKEGQGDA